MYNYFRENWLYKYFQSTVLNTVSFVVTEDLLYIPFGINDVLGRIKIINKFLSSKFRVTGTFSKNRIKYNCLL